MIKSLRVNPALLSIVLLMCIGSVSARTTGPIVPISRSAFQLNAVPLAVNSSQTLNIWASLMYTGGGDGYQDDDKDKDKDRNKG